jgi:cytochrome c553
LLPLLLLAGCGVADRTAADRFTRTGELVALSGGDAGASSACFTCHGPDGRGNGAGTPRLAGLDLGYLTAQLEGYASGRRKHVEMEWISKRLTPADRQRVSAYYAALPYSPAAGVIASGPGAALYHRGDPSRGLQPCATCHGEAGQGVGAGNPALAGQPAAYLAEQLDQWRASERRNDPDGVMLLISRRLRSDEVRSVSAYSSELSGGPPRPVSPAASPAARRADPRSGASAPHLHEAESR